MKKMKLTFLGAAQNVTGSCFLLEANGRRLLVDCGLYQERHLRARNWAPFPLPPRKLDAVLLTHAHLDHCGLLPKLRREGFRGKVYATTATCEIARIVLLDSAHIQEEDARYKAKRHRREGRKGRFPEVPLYTTEDAERSTALLRPVGYDQPIEVGDGLEATFRDAGHILGAAMIELKVSHDGRQRTCLFSGDVGRWDRPILRDPTLFERADYVLVESTYGDRLHESPGRTADALREVVNAAAQAGGNVIVPSFAVERAQEVLYHLNELLHARRVAPLPVYLDSPMAIRVTDVFEHHPEMLDAEALAVIRRDGSPFDFPGLKMARTRDESKAINAVSGTVMVIAGSGMCTGGRIKHHLVANITRPECTVLFVGYQAAGTLGRQIVEGAEAVRILGRSWPVRARIVRLHGFSAHADRGELLRWLGGLRQAPRHVFVVHGEPHSAEAFAHTLRERMGWEVSVPPYQHSVRLDG
jgi:metallo-beta-lactamase family protein